MRIKDIMRPLNQGPLPDYAPVLNDSADIYGLNPDQFSPEHETIYVADGAGQIVGKIGRETLVYLIGTNHMRQMSSIMNHVEEAVVAVDPQGRIFYANQSYASVLGVPLGKILGKDLHVIESEAALIQVLDTHESMVKEKTYIKSIGKYVSVRMFPLWIEGEFHGAISIFKDITETNKLNDEILRISEEVEEYKGQLNASRSLRALNLVGKDPGFQRVVSQALIVAKTDATVLIRGDHGTGKELIAKLIQSNSLRRDKPFVTVNCAAIPESLIESELFGYEGGSFTGAKKGGKIGKFQLADGGTIFLDEIGDMPVTMQSKLLRVLQEQEIELIGGSGNRSVDVRVIAATNQPLEELIEQRQFRKDLYYRLNVITLHIPTLKERPHDALLLINHYLALFNEKYGKNLAMDNNCLNALLSYDWPGNVRELRSCIEHAVILCTDSVIRLGDIPIKVTTTGFDVQPGQGSSSADGPVLPLHECLDRYERDLLIHALSKTGGNKTKAMRLLGLSRRTLYRKLNYHSIE